VTSWPIPYSGIMVDATQCLSHHCLPRRQTGTLQQVEVDGMTFFNQYMVLSYLARGNFGKVYLCLNTADHRLYAVKVRTTCL